MRASASSRCSSSREEVEIVEMIARANGNPAVLEDGPPDDEMVEAVRAVERRVLSGEIFQMSRGEEGQVFQTSGGPEAQVETEEASEPCDVRLRPGAGMATLRFRVTEDTYWQWKALSQVFRRTRIGGTFVAFVARNFWFQWKHYGEAFTGSPQEVLARSLYRCSNPTCGKKWMQDHHLIYRSRGGSNDVENRTALCPRCHHQLVHEGNIQVLAPASNMTWLIGRDPIMKIVGRKRILLDDEVGACQAS